MKNKQTGSFYNDSNSHADDIDEPKCQTCMDTGKYFQKTPDCKNCPAKNECDDYGKGVCSIPSDCPDCQQVQTEDESENMKKEIDSIKTLLSMYGVPEQRYSGLSTGIEVLMTRLRKEKMSMGYELSTKDKQIADQVVTINKLLEEIDNWKQKK